MYKSKLMLLSLFLAASTAIADDIKVGSTTRSMIVHAPTGIATGRPLVISMHGMNQSASYQQTTTNWDAVADTAKFVVVYPSSVGTTWDISGTSDLDFLKAIITEMNTRYGSDVSRVYLSGFSMGGMMTYHAAHKIADKIAAFAPVSGILLWSSDYTSSRPIPLIHVHGTGDDVVYYNNTAKNTRVQEYLKGWRTNNGCPSDSSVISPYPASKPASVGIQYTWGPCDDDVYVVHIALTGKGHWYSVDVNSVNTSEEIWNFAKTYSLSEGTVLPPEPPVVSFTSPTDSGTYTAPASIFFAVTATDSDGSVSHVDFFSNDSLIHSEWTVPYEFTWTDVTDGEYAIQAVAYDNDGNTASDTIHVLVESVVRAITTVQRPLSTLNYLVCDQQGRVLATVAASDLSSLKAAISKSLSRPGSYLVRPQDAQESSFRQIVIVP